MQRPGNPTKTHHDPGLTTAARCRIQLQTQIQDAPMLTKNLAVLLEFRGLKAHGKANQYFASRALDSWSFTAFGAWKGRSSCPPVQARGRSWTPACEREGIGRALSHLAPLAGRGRNPRGCARISGEGRTAHDKMRAFVPSQQGPSPQPCRKRGEGEIRQLQSTRCRIPWARGTAEDPRLAISLKLP